jgi:uridine kinase
MPKIIIINGPSCAGKSTVISQIFETKKDIFWLKYDSIKRFFVDYDPLVDRQKVIDLVITI